MLKFREITLLSVPREVFTHILLDSIKPLIHEKQRQEQSGFTPRRSTVGHNLILGILAPTRREHHQPLYAIYVDLKAAFDSVDRGALWKLIRFLKLLPKILSIIEVLYSNSVSCVRFDGDNGDDFLIKSGVREGRILAHDCFDVAMDWVLDRSTYWVMSGAILGQEAFTDEDYADDIVLLSELLSLLLSALKMFAEEAAPIGRLSTGRKRKSTPSVTSCLR